MPLLFNAGSGAAHDLEKRCTRLPYLSALLSALGGESERSPDNPLDAMEKIRLPCREKKSDDTRTVQVICRTLARRMVNKTI